jgi:WD40 repeat protein
MARNPKTSADEKQRKSSPDADPSATTSGRNPTNKRFDMKKFAERAAENLKWWRDHPEAAAARERERFLRELEIEPYIPPLEGHEDGVNSAAFSPDGTKVVTASVDQTARVWDAATGAEIAVLKGHEGNVISAAFSPDGTKVVTASVDQTARMWDAATGAEVAVLEGHDSRVVSAAFSPDGTKVVTASDDRTARMWAYV